MVLGGDADGLGADMVAAMDSNMSAYWSAYGRSGGCTLLEAPGIVAYATSVPHPLFNGAIVSREPGPELDAARTQLGEKIARDGTPALWWIGPAAQEEGTGERLASKGLAEAGTVPAMTARIDDLPAAAVPERLRIDAASTPPQRALWGRIAAVGTGFPGAAAEALADVEEGIPDTALAGQTRFTGYLDGKPVATSSLVLSHGLAGVYAVATLPEARRRGIGAAMTLHALQAAKAAGAQVAVLQSSSMGRPIYERMGFTRRFDYRIFQQT
ncbi:GNAT family N-acetyltransferase [Ostreiculturibacter nitratireducens]|uniref:GNAT family N-acetyltransferase n=1 Tax=Ostreiculturibacter nitratireducens TaxID=3075226 RepID=UPI0031B6314F